MEKEDARGTSLPFKKLHLYFSTLTFFLRYIPEDTHTFLKHELLGICLVVTIFIECRDLISNEDCKDVLNMIAKNHSSESNARNMYFKVLEVIYSC
jgi:hypothetical protein